MAYILMIFFDETIRILISGNVKKGPRSINAALAKDVLEQNAKKGQRLINVTLDVLEQNQANRLAKNPDRFSQDKLFGKFQTLSAGPKLIGAPSPPLNDRSRTFFLLKMTFITIGPSNVFTLHRCRSWTNGPKLLVCRDFQTTHIEH